MAADSFDLKDDHPHVWYVIFTDGNGDFWWQRLLKPGFRHCLVFRADRSRTLLISHRGYRLGIHLLNYSADGLAKAQATGGYTVLKYQHQPSAVPTYRTIMTCVSAVINVIGLTGVLALTPFGLYRALIRRQATKVEALQ